MFHSAGLSCGADRPRTQKISRCYSAGINYWGFFFPFISGPSFFSWISTSFLLWEHNQCFWWVVLSVLQHGNCRFVGQITLFSCSPLWGRHNFPMIFSWEHLAVPLTIYRTFKVMKKWRCFKIAFFYRANLKDGTFWRTSQVFGTCYPKLVAWWFSKPLPLMPEFFMLDFSMRVWVYMGFFNLHPLSEFRCEALKIHREAPT